MQKLSERTVDTTVYLKGQRVLLTRSSQNSEASCLHFWNAPMLLDGARPSEVPNHLKLLREISGVLQVAISLPRKGTVTD
jgi:hypothetical protein